MTPFYLHHLLSLLTQTSKTKKPCFQVFILSISNILLYRGWGGFLFTATSSILMFYQHSRYGSTIVSTLVYGCEETTCYFCFADRYREAETAGHFLLDSYHQEAFCSNKKYIYIHTQHIAPSLGCTILQQQFLFLLQRRHCNESRWFKEY